MTKVNRPRVRMFIGRVKIIMIGFINALRIPRTNATIRAVAKVFTLKPGTYCETTKIASAERSQLIRILNITLSICEHIFDCKQLKRKY